MPEPRKKVVLTRTRWDAYFAPVFIVAIAVGVFLVWQTGQLRFAVSPICVLPLWIMLRLKTPREGLHVSTIRSTPGAVTMLWCCGAALALSGILVAIDIYWLGHAFRDPLEPYHALMFSPPFIVMILGPLVIEKLRRSRGNPEA